MYNIYISDFNYIIVILSFAELHFSVQFNNKVTMQLSNKKIDQNWESKDMS